jgi:AraC-like DNA-binding protein
VLAAGRRGVAPEALLGPIGADPAQIDDPDAHVPIAWVIRAWTEAPVLTGDPAFGLHAAELMAGTRAHVLDYVAAHCQRPRELFACIQRYQRLLMSAADLRLDVSGGVATFSHPLEKIPFARPPQIDEFVVAQWVLAARARSRRGFPLRRVTFDHPRPADTREHARIFQAPVEFGAPVDAIEFDAALLDVDLEGADPTLVSVLRRHAEALLAEAPGPEAPATVAGALRRHLVGLPPSSPAAVEEAARALGMSARSLQRRLGAEGTSFKDVVDDVRRDLSRSYLHDPRYGISEVAFLVGFAEVSAFSRAFRRWTGESPVAWRRANTAGARGTNSGARGQDAGQGEAPG